MAVIESPHAGVADTLADRPPAERPRAARPCALEGLILDTLEEAEELAAFVGLRLHDLGRRVNVIVNYDNFELGRGAAPRVFEMVREHERRYFLSSTRYSTDAFLRRKLGLAFADTRLSQTIYRSFEEGTHALGEHSSRPAPCPPSPPMRSPRSSGMHFIATPRLRADAPAPPRKQLRSAAQRVRLTPGDRPTRP